MNRLRGCACTLLICIVTTLSAQRTPREVADWLGVGWNLGNQLDAHQRGVSNETSQWGGADEQKLQSTLSRMYDVYVSHGIPVYIGEMGCVRRAGAEEEAIRLHYLQCYARLCRQYALSFFYWDNGSPHAGRECSGLLNHATGQWNNDGREVMKTMVNNFQ